MRTKEPKFIEIKLSTFFNFFFSAYTSLFLFLVFLQLLAISSLCSLSWVTNKQTFKKPRASVFLRFQVALK